MVNSGDERNLAHCCTKSRGISLSLYPLQDASSNSGTFRHRSNSLPSNIRKTYAQLRSLQMTSLSQSLNVHASLTNTIPTSGDSRHHVLASRALVLTRSQQWDDAIDDAKNVSSLFLFFILMLIYTQSIKVQPSMFGYIAMSSPWSATVKSTRHIGRATSRSNTVTHLTFHFSFYLRYVSCGPEHGFLSEANITQAIVVFMAGEHDDTISRIDDVISMVHFSSICHVVQACTFTTRQL